MITKEQAIQLGDGTLRGPIFDTAATVGRGKNQRPMEWRANGRCKTWKTRPAEFLLPVKTGFKTCAHLTHTTGRFVTLDENEARRALNLPEVS